LFHLQLFWLEGAHAALGGRMSNDRSDSPRLGVRIPGSDAPEAIIAASEAAVGAGRFSRRRLLSAAAAVAAGWAVDALRTPGAGAVAGGSFVRSVINVKRYGAKGDGGDDTRALQRAIGVSRPGDALYFPAGTYVVSEPLLPKPDQLFFGQTARAIIKAHPRKPPFPIFVVRSGPVEFRRLTIEGSRNAYAGFLSPPPAICGQPGPGGMILLSVTACRIQQAWGEGIRIAGGSGSGQGPQRVTVRDTVVEDCGQDGLSLGRLLNILVRSCRFERCNNGIKMYHCQNAVVQGVTAQLNRRHGIAFAFSQRWRVDHCRALANGLGKEQGWGIVAGGDEKSDLAPNSDFTISDNVCVANLKGGISLDPTKPAEEGKKEAIWPQRARVAGNRCSGAKLNHGIRITHASDVLVADNVCDHNKFGAGIELVDSERVLVQDNRCHHNKIGIADRNDTCAEDHGLNQFLRNRLYKNDDNDPDVKHTNTNECHHSARTG
jgi:Pectate lyase superfamily protein/Right handed beta helix region